MGCAARPTAWAGCNGAPMQRGSTRRCPARGRCGGTSRMTAGQVAEAGGGGGWRRGGGGGGGGLRLRSRCCRCLFHHCLGRCHANHCLSCRHCCLCLCCFILNVIIALVIESARIAMKGAIAVWGYVEEGL
jgi:hypothetical protein